MNSGLTLIIAPKQGISLTLPDRNGLVLELGASSEGLTLELGSPVEKHYPIYDDPYIVTPDKTEQVLDTDDHLMAEDLTVLGVPYAEVGNVGGGYTVTIGG